MTGAGPHSDASTTAATQHGDTRRLWSFIGWYGASELAQRVTRIATTILLARWLTPEAFGVAAIAITAFELVRIVANCGIGQSVIRASDEELNATLALASRLLPRIMLGLAVIQVIVGFAIAAVTGRTEIAVMLAALAGVYLMMPLGLIETYLLQRQERHRTIAGVATAQAVADNVLTAVLALAGFGAWAIVLPKVLTTPLWVIGMRRAIARPDLSAITPKPATELIAYAGPLVATELATAARLHLDKVLVGAILGVEALGIYYFVFNAGLGLSLSLTTALANSVYPHFARVAHDAGALQKRFTTALLSTAIPLGAVIGLQAALATLYVPALFGAKWASSALLVSLLTASAVAKPLSDVASQLLRVTGKTFADLALSVAVTFATLSALAFALSGGLEPGVTAMAYITVIAQLAFTLAAGRIAFGRFTAPRSVPINGTAS